VKNRDTGNVSYKTPEEFAENRDKYEVLPQEYHRNPHGKPRKPPDMREKFLPEPPEVPRPKRPKKPKHFKPITPVKIPEVPEPPQPAPRNPPLGLKYKKP
jgi:hypothetical protein